MSFQDRPSRERPWVIIFILLSLIAHLIFVLAIVLITHFLPTPKLKHAEDLASTSITLAELPPEPKRTPPPPPPPKHIFMPTSPDAQATHKEVPIESDVDSRLRSHSQVARDSTSLLPDVDVKRKHPANLHDAPNAPSTSPPRPASAADPDKNQQQQQKTPPIPEQLKPQTETAHATKPTPQPQPLAKTENQTPSKTQTAQPQKETLNPDGLPVLPPINAPTIAPRTMHAEAQVASSIPELAQNSRGAIGAHGEDSPAAMATELGRYKAKVYRAVGARWYHKVDMNEQYLPVGVVHIQFTIHKDGSVETKVLGGDNSTLQSLLSISLNSIIESAPFDPFTDSMIKEVGDSYTDDFSFSIYGGGD